jgi:hypothetical protein
MGHLSDLMSLPLIIRRERRKRCNAEYLEKLIPDFGWQVDLFAGYDIVPEDYQAQGKRQVSDMQGTVKGRRC